MNYLARHLEDKLERAAKAAPALLLCGARQVGKSTLLAHLFGSKAKHVVFDPVVDVGDARRDPEFFLEQHPPPLILDEIQYAPELLPVIKRRVDADPSPSQYLMTGSQNLSLLKAVAESLAGRVFVFELGGMTLAERRGAGSPGRQHWLEAVLDGRASEPKDFAAFRRAPSAGADDTLFSRLWRGGFPRTLGLDDDLLQDMLWSYVRTYVERDIRLLSEVQDQQLFSRFFALCAALSAQEVNHSQLGRELGVAPQTASRWLAALKATYQWLELPAYHGNAIKRLSSKPKGHLTDTGLAACLQRISSAEALSGHPALGALFETHVVLDLHRVSASFRTPPQLHHWRAHSGAELDLLLERDGRFWPVEMKCKSKPTVEDTCGIKAFKETYPRLPTGVGLVIAACQEPYALRDGSLVIPYDLMV